MRSGIPVEWGGVMWLLSAPRQIVMISHWRLPNAVSDSLIDAGNAVA
jgi:hypothetical protein